MKHSAYLVVISIYLLTVLQGCQNLKNASKKRKDLLLTSIVKHDLITVKRLLDEGMSADTRYEEHISDDDTDRSDTEINNASALMLAAVYGDLKIAELLLKYGADPNFLDSKGDTALAWNSYGVYTKSNTSSGTITALLIANGAKVNNINSFGRSILIMATMCKDISSARVLINHGADVNYQDKDGRSALMYSVNFYDSDMVALLLKSNASIHALDNNSNNIISYLYMEPVNLTFGQGTQDPNKIDGILTLLKAASKPDKPNKRGRKQ